jgi:hypothetical protein
MEEAMSLSRTYATIEIYGVGGNASEHPFYKKDKKWAYLTHAVINGEMGCKISGKYLCWDTSIEDQNGIPTCPTCAKKVKKLGGKLR